MKLSIQTKPLEDRFGQEKTLEIIKNSGFDGIDLNLDLYAKWSETYKERNFSSFIFDRGASEEYAYKLKDLLSKYNLSCLQAHSPMPSYYTDEELGKMTIEAQKNSIRICGIVGCKNMTIHPYYPSPIENQIPIEDEDRINFEEFFPPLFASLEENNVTACLEDLPVGNRRGSRSFRGILTVPERAIEYVDKLNSLAGKELFGLCCDTGHLVCTSSIPYDYIKAVGDRIKIVHIHDNRGLKDEHLIPYSGYTNWDMVCRAFHDIGYCKEENNLSFEIFPLPAKLPEDLIQPYYNLAHAVGMTLIDKIVNEKY